MQKKKTTENRVGGEVRQGGRKAGHRWRKIKRTEEGGVLGGVRQHDLALRAVGAKAKKLVAGYEVSVRQQPRRKKGKGGNLNGRTEARTKRPVSDMKTQGRV